MPKRKQKGLVLLSYLDSEHEEEDQDDDEQHDYEDLKSNDESNEHFNDDNVGGGEQKSNKLVENEKKIYFEDIYGDRDLSILEFHQSLLGRADADDIQIPAATRTPCPNELQNQIENLYEKVKEGYDLIHAIQKRKSMRNPSIYEKMISYCEINEMATNYPKEIYDPEPFLQAQSFYEELSRQQKEEMEKREKDKLKQKTLTSSSTIGENSKKSKWDSSATSSSSSTSTSAAIAAALAAANKVKHLTNSNPQQQHHHHHHHQHQHSSAKPTVISAFGTITKKK